MKPYEIKLQAKLKRRAKNNKVNRRAKKKTNRLARILHSIKTNFSLRILNG
jgi:hypothetical protein